MTRSPRVLLGVGLVAVVAIGVVAVATRPPGTAIATPTPPASAPASVDAVPTAGVTTQPTGLARFEGAGWHLDYPATWSRYRGMPSRYSGTLGILASQPVDTDEACETDSGTLLCDQAFIDLEPGGVLVWITIQGIGPMLIDPIEKWLHPAFGAPTVLAGGRAIVREADAPDGHSIEFDVIDPANALGGIELHIELHAPVSTDAQELASAVIDSFAFDPPIEALDPGDAPAIVGSTLAELRNQDPGYMCFPVAPGTELEATVTALPGYGLTHGLPVRCTTTIEATPIGFWRLRFEARWDTTPGGEKGTMTVTVWVNANGQVAASDNAHSGPPYCCTP